MRNAWVGALLALVLMPAAALAAERPVGLQDQTGMAVTIYNEDLALVRDRRTVTLDQGENHLAFIDVSAMIRPETALLVGEKAPLTILEQNFDFDLLTPEKLLEKSVGDKVRVITTNPATGAETAEEATVLSTADGLVLQVGDRIETNPRGRIVFSGVPSGLSFPVEIRNARTVPIVATVLESIPGDWRMLSESLSHESPSSSQAQWQIPVPAEGKVDLAYKVRVAF